MVLALIAATVVKLTWLCTTLGTADLAFFRDYALKIEERGLPETYRTVTYFNHTPLVAGWSLLCERLSSGDPRWFSRIFRLPGLFADAAVVFGLLRLRRVTGAPPVWALMLFAASPVSAMVTGFHGNVDPLLAAALFFATLACVDGKVVRSAAFLALACNIKVAALLAAPALGAWWLFRGQGRKFFAWSACIALAGWSWPLAVCPAAFLTNVFGYSGFWGIWGIWYWMRQFGGTGFAGVIYHDLTTEQAWVMGMLKYGVLAGAAFVGWIRRREDESGLFRTLALTWLVFLIFSPSVAAQYLVWPAAFLLVWSPRWYAGITLAASVFLGAFYTILCRGWPWDFGVSDKDTCPLWLPWSNIAWVGVVVAGVGTVLSRNRFPENVSEPNTAEAKPTDSPAFTNAKPVWP